jgi:hypothetical protein
MALAVSQPWRRRVPSTRVLAILCKFASIRVKAAVLGRFPMACKHHILLLMQQILAFPVSFVDTRRASDKLRPALFRWNSPFEIESAIILN